MLSVISCATVRQYAAIFTANLCIMCVGMGLAWPSPVLLKLKNDEETPLISPISGREGSWIVSVSFLSGLSTIPFMGLIVAHVGKKQCLLIGYLPKIISAFFALFSTTYWMLLIGRVFNGIGDVFFVIVVYPYAAEIASKNIRGSLGTIAHIMGSLGMLIMLSVGPYVTFFAINVTYTSILVITLIPILILPESPHFLYTKGRKDDALKVLKYFRGSESSALVDMKEYALSEDVKHDKKALLKNTTLLKATLLSIALALGTQLVGYNCVSYYLQTVLQLTKTSVEPALASVIVGVIQLLASIFSCLVIDKYGRKPVLGVTFIGMALGMMGLGVFFKFAETREVYGFMNYFPLISLGLVVICFHSGIGSLYLLLVAELLDSSFRMIGTCISVFFSALTQFLLTKYFELLISLIGTAVIFWIFCANCLLFFLFVIFCIPETKNKMFSEIQRALGDTAGNI